MCLETIKLSKITNPYFSIFLYFFLLFPAESSLYRQLVIQICKRVDLICLLGR